jgi:transcriptional regulator with AAA-type ATPase domain
MLGRSILNFFDCTLESLFSAAWENHRVCMTARAPDTHGDLGGYFADVTRLSDKSTRHYSPNNTLVIHSTTEADPDIPSPAGANYPPKIKLMLEALRSNRWNITDTANELNVSRSTIYRRIWKYGIVPPNQQGIG